MGMTIEEHKEHLLDIMDSMPDDTCGDWRDSLAYAIETMHKYKKIQEIMNGLNGNFYGSYLKDRQTLEKIYKVIKDGKID